MKNALLIVAVGMVLAMVVAANIAHVQAQHDDQPQHTLAKRLEGRWIIDDELTHRLSSNDSARPFNGAVAFVPDDAVAQAVRDAGHLPDDAGSLFATGYMQWGQSDMLNGLPPEQRKKYMYPYVVAVRRGQVGLIYFTGRGANIYQRAEWRHATLIPAGDEKNDILFIGGIGGTISFRAYKRVAGNH